MTDMSLKGVWKIPQRCRVHHQTSQENNSNFIFLQMCPLNPLWPQIPFQWPQVTLQCPASHLPVVTSSFPKSVEMGCGFSATDALSDMLYINHNVLLHLSNLEPPEFPVKQNCLFPSFIDTYTQSYLLVPVCWSQVPDDLLENQKLPYQIDFFLYLDIKHFNMLFTLCSAR